ncbi:hypothetical protein ROP_35980 [Rhodococcus opacus B4]|uniref:Uncharacterized protein n=1 Tax=Rhodococcus opacus (strain B4) TaxID=632772 RepID=C1B842_RHOOB|nr:hypothetical protein ROP_35980 [Rhodococcus opacus B4]
MRPVALSDTVTEDMHVADSIVYVVRQRAPTRRSVLSYSDQPFEVEAIAALQ